MQFRKLQPSPRYVPYIRPSPPYIIDVRAASTWRRLDLLTPMFSSRAAPTSKSLSRQRVYIALYKIHSHLHEQNPMSGECGHGSLSLCTIARVTYLMSLLVDARGPPHTYRFYEWGVHGMERVDIQF